jgi:hypothetical protein
LPFLCLLFPVEKMEIIGKHRGALNISQNGTVLANVFICLFFST